MGAITGLLLLPASAGAQIDFPLLPEIPTPDLPSPGDLVRSTVKALFELLFGDIPKRITEDVLRWLLTHPDITAGARFHGLERGAVAVREVAYGLAIAFFCAGVVRNVFDDATSGALEAARRFVLAMAGITVWPWAFALAVRFSNLATEAFLEVPELSRTTIAMLSFAFVGGAAMGIGFICGLIAAVLLIALFLEKVLVLTGLVVLYVLMPALMAASPFPPTSHLLGVGAAAFTALLVVNPLWTALLAVFALVGEGALVAGAAAVEDFIEPLVAIAMLALVVGSLPLLLRMAWVRGVAAALMAPAVGAHQGGGSPIAAAATVAHGGRTLLEQRSSQKLQQSAWQVDDFAAASTGPGAAVPSLGQPRQGTSSSRPSARAADGAPPRRLGTPASGFEQPAPGVRDHALAEPHNAPPSRQPTPPLGASESLASQPSKQATPPPQAATDVHRPEQLRLPLDDQPQDQ